MTYPVHPGSESEDAERRQRYEWFALAFGGARLTIPLNGGSESRRAERERWQAYAAALGCGYYANGCIVIIGGRP